MEPNTGSTGASAPAAPAARSEAKAHKVTLAVVAPPFTDNFVLHIDKKPVTITRNGVEVDEEVVEQILAAAKESGVKIKKTES